MLRSFYYSNYTAGRPRKAPMKTTKPEMRSFESGAIRNTDDGKLDYEGFLSPLALKRYAEYLNQHRRQADGKLRPSDNWQKGFPFAVYMKSLWRHFMDFWALHRGWSVVEDGECVTKQDALCAVLFNAMGYLHELIKAEEEEEKEGGEEEEPGHISMEPCVRCLRYNTCRRIIRGDVCEHYVFFAEEHKETVVGERGHDPENPPYKNHPPVPDGYECVKTGSLCYRLSCTDCGYLVTIGEHAPFPPCGAQADGPCSKCSPECKDHPDHATRPDDGPRNFRQGTPREAPLGIEYWLKDSPPDDYGRTFAVPKPSDQTKFANPMHGKHCIRINDTCKHEHYKGCLSCKPNKPPTFKENTP